MILELYREIPHWHQLYVIGLYLEISAGQVMEDSYS